MTTEALDQLARALDATEQVVAAVGDDQWTDRTPCTEWTVRDLFNHMVAGNRMFAGIARGDPPAAPGSTAAAVADLDDDPVSAYRSAADALLAAFRQPGVLEAMLSVPVGSVPGVAAVHLRITEMLVHGWDLARATGQAARFPDDLAEQELDFSRAKLADIPPGRRPFAPPQPVPDDAPPIDRLAALLGRSVPTVAPGGGG